MVTLGGGDGPPLYRIVRSVGVTAGSSDSTHWHLVKDSHNPGRKARVLSEW